MNKRDKKEERFISNGEGIIIDDSGMKKSLKEVKKELKKELNQVKK